MLNQVCLMGRLAHDPELRKTQNDTAVCSFSIACERDGNGKETDFLDCTAWRQTAEFVSQYFMKGSMVVVVGRLQIRKYKDRDGNNRTAPEIMVDRVYFGESKKRNDAEERPPHPTDADAPPEVDQAGLAALASAYPGNVQFADPGDDGDLPF